MKEKIGCGTLVVLGLFLTYLSTEPYHGLGRAAIKFVVWLIAGIVALAFIMSMGEKIAFWRENSAEVDRLAGIATHAGAQNVGGLGWEARRAPSRSSG